MTYYGGKELAAAFRTVRGNTIKAAEEIPEDKYSFRAAEGTRSVAELLAHITYGAAFHKEITLKGRNNLDGFDFMSFMGGVAAQTNKPRSKAELVALLKTEGENFATSLEALSEDFLQQVVTFPQGAIPPSRTRFEMLLSAKEHEMHHRGQLMLLQRMIGIKPHLTRANEERMAAMQAQAANK